MEILFVCAIVIMLSGMVFIAILLFIICAVICMKKMADMTIEMMEKEKRIKELEAEKELYQKKECN